MRRLTRAAGTVLVSMLVLCAPAWGQLLFKAPQSVRHGLSVMHQVVENSGRLINARRYAKLPAQSRELEAGIDSLERGLGEQPSSVKNRLVLLIAQSRVAAAAMTEAATHHRTTLLPIVHKQLAQAVSALIALFPKYLRPRASPAHQAND